LIICGPFTPFGADISRIPGAKMAARE
jgi:hypothetical protein